MTHVSTPIFQGLFKNIAFRSVAFILKKLWAILDFLLHRPDFLPPCTIPYIHKKITKYSFKLLFMKSQKFTGDSESARFLENWGKRHTNCAIINILNPLQFLSMGK